MTLACLAARRLAPAAAATAARGDAHRLPLLCRAAGTKAARGAASDVALFNFEQAPSTAPLFPELLQPGRRAVLLAVDPDLKGAVAAISWLNPPAPSPDAAPQPDADGDTAANLGSSSSSSSSSGATTSINSNGVSGHDARLVAAAAAAAAGLPRLEQVAVELHDMPVEVWQYGSRDKRQPDAASLISILQRYAQMTHSGPAFGLRPSTPAAGAPPQHSPEAAPQGSGKRKRAKRTREGGSSDGTPLQEPAGAASALPASGDGSEAAPADAPAAAAALGERELAPVVRAVVEYSLPPHVCGKFAWYGIGFAIGLLNGLLAAQGIPYRRVHASTWKVAMGLKRQGKDSSIALARHLLPAAERFLMRKKDHGRAEALLLATWAMGIRMEQMTCSDGGSEVEEAEGGFSDEDVDPACQEAVAPDAQPVL